MTDTIGVIVGLIIIVFAIAVLVGESKTMPQKIEEECRRSYGHQGDHAVLDCQLAMSVQYLNDADRSRANSTYDRIR